MQGGAVSWVNGTTASLQASQLIGNSASASGGALYVQNCQGSLSLAGSEVTYNTASQNGGGIFQVAALIVNEQSATARKHAALLHPPQCFPFLVSARCGLHLWSQATACDCSILITAELLLMSCSNSATAL